MKFSKFVDNMIEKIFREKPKKESNPPVTPVTIEEESRPNVQNDVVGPEHSKKRSPYFIQIGFDFGTSYSKCICRDLSINKAWVYLPSTGDGQELPFLMPSALQYRNEELRIVENPASQYPEDGLYHIKQALVKVAQKQWNHPVLAPYRRVISLSELEKLPAFVESCAVFYLAKSLSDVRATIKRRLRDFGTMQDDYMAVNLAVPVSDAEQPEINEMYKKILVESWCLADKLTSRKSIHMHELMVLRGENCKKRDAYAEEACFIYPEVSANVQGFVRSRVSSQGMYFFSDTGASTVDQSVFIFNRQNGTEHLIYLVGRVLPLGSSNIESLAAESCGNSSSDALEAWRAKKERGNREPELLQACHWIANKLSQDTESTLAHAKQKLYVADQLNEIRIIFGGGGHCDYPYKAGVMKPFSGQLFRRAINPDVVGLPLPRDLELKQHESRWMKRLSVAYGLSFEKNELAGFTYPKDVSIPDPEELWRPRKNIPDAPTKDVC